MFPILFSLILSFFWRIRLIAYWMYPLLWNVLTYNYRGIPYSKYFVKADVLLSSPFCLIIIFKVKMDIKLNIILIS